MSPTLLFSLMKDSPAPTMIGCDYKPNFCAEAQVDEQQVGLALLDRSLEIIRHQFSLAAISQ
jgi:hypothetical protein